MLAVKKVILAEDDVDDQQIFYEFLHRREDLVLLPTVENGVELIDALEKIKDANNLPDLIILDQNMPLKNGLQTLETLKMNDRYKSIPVLVYSTYTDETLIKNCTEMGACSVMPKPVTKEGYNQLIDTVLQICH